MSMFAKRQEIENLIKSTADALGYKIISVNLLKSGNKSAILKITIDRYDNNKVRIADCQAFSKMIAPILDVEDVIREKYYLEVESAGVERRLRDIEDFIKFINHEIVVTLINAIDGNKKYEGVILNVKQQQITLSLKNGHHIDIDYDNIKTANTVFTDEMFRQITKNY